MINGIVFSKDRAAQLDLLLKSISKNAKDVFQLKVIYASSEISFEKGYEKLIDKHPEVKWMKESTNFKNDVMSKDILSLILYNSQEINDKPRVSLKKTIKEVKKYIKKIY